MMNTYSINLNSHIRLLWPYIFATILLPAIMYFLLIYKRGYFDLELALLAGSIFFVIISIPVFSLHLKYYLTNRNDLFNYDRLNQKIIYQTEQETTEFTTSDIEKIIVYKSHPIAETRTPTMIWDYCNYAIIKLKDGKIFKISGLLVYELDKVVKFENTEVKKTFLRGCLNMYSSIVLRVLFDEAQIKQNHFYKRHFKIAYDIHTHPNDRGLSDFTTNRGGRDSNVYGVGSEYWGNPNAKVISVGPTKVHSFISINYGPRYITGTQTSWGFHNHFYFPTIWR
mgnify:CR=1 FL=1